MKNREPIIKFDNFTFRYDSQAEPNLIDINFEIYPGETVLVVGPSGSGKSSLGKAINGQIPHTFPGEMTGKVRVNGTDTQEGSVFDLSLSVGTVLQDADAQFVGLTVAEDLAFSLENEGVPQDEMHGRVDKWAEILDLAVLKENRPQQLSGGQKQRVSIGGVLINELPILLFDEPLANLDPKAGLETLKLIDDLSKTLNLTTIIIEHRLEECLEADIDRVLVMNEGRLAGNMTVDELLRSDLLDEIGLRQPLYLTALEHAGYSLNHIEKIGAYKETEIPSEGLQAVEDYYGAVPASHEKDRTENVLEVSEVSFAYPRQTTPPLTDITFSVTEGEMISIIGSNGAGKSTMAKVICGFERPEKGTIVIDGINQADLSIKEIADKIGYVMQNPNQMISKTMIYDEVALGLVNRGWSEEDIQDRVYATLKICGLYPFRNWPISALSYGQKRRVTIASILVLNPEIIILDEPTAGQDYRNYTSMMDFLVKLNTEYQMTILMITHDMHLMQEYTDRSLVFDSGRLIADTVPSVVFSSEELMGRANLALTSLYYLGNDLPHMTTQEFLALYMEREKGSA